MIRILHVVGGMNQGGTENLLMNIYRKIDKNRFQFDFLVNREGIFDEEIKNMGGKIFYISALQNIGMKSYINKLDCFLKEHNEYKIIHSHINHVTGLILERANKAGIPNRIAHSHSSKSSTNPIIRIYKNYLGHKIIPNATCLMACSEQAGKWLYGKKNNNFIIVKNAIEVDKFCYSENIRKNKRKELNLDDNIFVIGDVARFSKVKNHEFLLKIFRELYNMDNNTRLILVGSGERKNEIIQHSKKLDIYDNIIWLENRTDVNEILQAMDYFVFPSKYEGLGIVLIEAQASGFKSIASEKVIPNEAKVTDLLQFYPLTKTPRQWAEEIYNNRNYERHNVSEQILKQGYDLNNSVKMLENLYEDMLEGN